MDDVISRLRSSPEDLSAAIVQRMFQADRSQQAALRADLARYVARLDDSPGAEPDEDDPLAPGRVPPPTRPAGRSLQSDAEIERQLPRRTTHGGDFGPAVRAKLIAELRTRGL